MIPGSGGNAMKCNFLSGKRILTCMVNAKIFVPSLSELEQYCQSANSELCPVLNTKTDDDECTAHGRGDRWPVLG